MTRDCAPQRRRDVTNIGNEPTQQTPGPFRVALCLHPKKALTEGTSGMNVYVISRSQSEVNYKFPYVRSIRVTWSNQ